VLVWAGRLDPSSASNVLLSGRGASKGALRMPPETQGSPLVRYDFCDDQRRVSVISSETGSECRAVAFR
jgi:hypothetical protein